jgi:putative heme transporter
MTHEVTPPPATEEATDRGSRRMLRRALVMLAKIAIAVVACRFLLSFIRGVNWEQIGAAMSQLTATQVAALLVLVAIRQTDNAAPMALFISGLGLRHAVTGDLSAILVSTVAPPPTDTVMRFSMFRSWDIDVSHGAVGVSLNTVTYYAVRFAAPVLGFLLLLFAEGYDSTYAAVAVFSGLVAAAIAVTLILVVRADRFAAAIGRLGGRIGHRFRPDQVDPEHWAEVMVEFRSTAADTLRAKWAWALLTMVGLLVVDAIFLTATMRFMSIPSAELTFAEILAGYLCAYPLTALPFAGLGVMDAALIALYTERGASDEATVFAALLVWRLATVLLPLLLGLVAYTLWRRANPAEAQRVSSAAATGDVPQTNAGETGPTQLAHGPGSDP